MKRILVATDFSTRSDRALRRATLLARQTSAEIVLVHVVDDDQAPRLLKAEEREATQLIDDLAASLREIDRVPCKGHVMLGEPFQVIASIAEDIDADVVVMGPHRRQALRDVFIGTTVERTISRIRRPVIMANAVPSGVYSRILVTTDLSDCSATAVKAARKLGFFNHTEVLLLHAFDAPAQGMVIRSSMTTDQLKDYIAEEEERATGELTKFMRKVEIAPSRRFVQLIEGSAPDMIQDCIRKQKVDLVVIGTHGRTGAAKFFLGSVAEEVLRSSGIDVLAVPADAGLLGSTQP